MPETSLPPDLIEGFLAQPDDRELKQTATMVWLGGPVSFDISESVLSITTKQETIYLDCSIAEGQWLSTFLNSISKEDFTFKSMMDDYSENHLQDFESLWESELMEVIREIGLLAV